MTTGGIFIAGDWGTSHLRLFLSDRDGKVLDTTTGPGAAAVNGRFASAFASLTAGWNAKHGELPAVLCGMVGSNIGWTQTQYVACPADPEQIGTGCVALEDGRVHIVPGLTCRNRLGAPDFLRGEETQILGALHLAPELRRGRQLLCLPGTHTKWVAIEDGSVSDFLTAPTGEVFSILRDHSVLVRDSRGGDVETDMNAFGQGARSVGSLPEAQVLHRLFEARSRQLSGEFAAAAASAYLSGLLIATDVGAALRIFPREAYPNKLILIGDPRLTVLYANVCALQAIQTQQLDGVSTSLRGLAHLHVQLSNRRLQHAL